MIPSTPPIIVIPEDSIPDDTNLPSSLQTLSDIAKKEKIFNTRFPAGMYYFTYSFYPGEVMSPIARYRYRNYLIPLFLLYHIFISIPIHSDVIWFRAKQSFSRVIFSNLEFKKGYTRIFYISSDGEHFSRIDALYTNTGDSSTAISTSNERKKKKGQAIIEKDQLTRFVTAFGEYQYANNKPPILYNGQKNGYEIYSIYE